MAYKYLLVRGRSQYRIKGRAPSIFEYQTGRSTYTFGVKLHWEKIGEINSCQKNLVICSDVKVINSTSFKST